MKQVKITCPRCGSASNELMDCDNCQDIGCIRCMKKSQGKWVCHSCKPTEIRQDFSNAFSSMFG